MTERSRRPRIGVTLQTVTQGPALWDAVPVSYIGAITAAGGDPICVPLRLSEESLRNMYSLLDGLLFPGGCDVSPGRYGAQPHPMLGEVDEDRDDLELTLARWALADDLPVLGICRGIQLLGVAAGGTLYQDLNTERPDALTHVAGAPGKTYLAHDIHVRRGTRLHDILGDDIVPVNSRHHQAVRDVPGGFIVSAVAPDDVIEAIEAADKSFVLGIQCHPENLWNTTSPAFTQLFDEFVDAARQRKTAAITT